MIEILTISLKLIVVITIGVVLGTSVAMIENRYRQHKLRTIKKIPRRNPNPDAGVYIAGGAGDTGGVATSIGAGTRYDISPIILYNADGREPYGGGGGGSVSIPISGLYEKIKIRDEQIKQLQARITELIELTSPSENV